MEDRGRRILLVDDDPGLLEVLGELLTRHGYVVTAADSVGGGLAELARASFDAVVTDVIFNGEPGARRILAAVLARSPGTPVLLMTGRPALEAAVAAIKEGATDYMQKPIDGALLAARIDLAIRESSLQRESLEFGELVDILSRMVALTIERIDPYTAGHGARTRRYCDLLARDLDIDVPTREKLELAAIAHDYGKIYLDDLSFLTKRGPLSASEYAQVQRHAELGAQKLGTHGRLRDVCRWIAEHHERWDGSGYPLHKEGEEISLCGRILASVEVFDSLATARSYKEPWELGRVIEFFQRERGRGFDPLVIEALVPRLECTGEDWLRAPLRDAISAGAVPA